MYMIFQNFHCTSHSQSRKSIFPLFFLTSLSDSNILPSDNETFGTLCPLPFTEYRVSLFFGNEGLARTLSPPPLAERGSLHFFCAQILGELITDFIIRNSHPSLFPIQFLCISLIPSGQSRSSISERSLSAYFVIASTH